MSKDIKKIKSKKRFPKKYSSGRLSDFGRNMFLIRVITLDIFVMAASVLRLFDQAQAILGRSIVGFYQQRFFKKHFRFF